MPTGKRHFSIMIIMFVSGFPTIFNKTHGTSALEVIDPQLHRGHDGGYLTSMEQVVIILAMIVMF